MGLRQCPKRLWLDVHAPEKRADSEASLAKFAVGDLVGALAREIYDSEDNGILVDVMGLGPDQAIVFTESAMDRRVPIFEAGFQGGGARAFVDVLLPSRRGGSRSWDLIEVKSSSSPKQSHRDDIAIQAYVLLQAGVTLGRVKLACIDPGFIYRGDHDYRGLLREFDLTEEVAARGSEVASWIKLGHETAGLEESPAVAPGIHCRSPYACGYLNACKAEDPAPIYPIDWLPHLQGDLRRYIAEHRIRDLRDVPEERLSELQRRIRACTLEDRVFIDEGALNRALATIEAPVSYLDFETVQLAVPIWRGARPYQTFPFQWSLHILDRDGCHHADFLDLSGAEPSAGFLEALIKALPPQGSILVWNASVEKTVLNELGSRHPVHAKALKDIAARVIDLAAIVEATFYHPRQKGSYRLKRVLPALKPELDYAGLEGVKDGLMALMAYVEAIQADCDAQEKAEIAASLKAYCKRDTLALFTIHQALLQRGDPASPAPGGPAPA